MLGLSIVQSGLFSGVRAKGLPRLDSFLDCYIDFLPMFSLSTICVDQISTPCRLMEANDRMHCNKYTPLTPGQPRNSLFHTGFSWWLEIMSSEGFHITEQLTVGRKFSRLSSEKYLLFPLYGIIL